MPQPPPPDRVTAVRIPSRQSTTQFLVEARLAVDQYERSDRRGDGIPSEGVIVYQVLDTHSVFLRTIPALDVGGRYENPGEGLTVVVNSAIPGGFSVTVTREPSAECPAIAEKISAVLEAMEGETDPFLLRQLRTRLAQLRAKAVRLGCPRTPRSDAADVALS